MRKISYDVVPKPTEDEILQMFEQSKKEMELQEENTEKQSTEDELSDVPNFGTTEENLVTAVEDEQWDLSGTIEECIVRYASKLSTEQINEILLGLENGLTDKQVKTYFTLSADKMNQYRRAYQFGQK